MIHSWLSARKINTFKTSGPKGKGRPLLKSTRWMIYRAESSFQPIWMRRKDFFYISPRFNARTRILAAHQQMEGTGNYRAGICKTPPKSKKWLLILLCTEFITANRALQWLSSDTRQTEPAQVTGRAGKSHLGRDRGILWDSDNSSGWARPDSHSICCT